MISQTLSGRPMSVQVRDLERHQAHHGREALALEEDVRPEAAEVRVLVAEVELPALGELFRPAVSEHRREPRLHLLRARGRQGQRTETAVDAHLRHRARRQVEVGGPDGAGVPQQVLERRFRIGREVEGRELPAARPPRPAAPPDRAA